MLLVVELEGGIDLPFICLSVCLCARGPPAVPPGPSVGGTRQLPCRTLSLLWGRCAVWWNYGSCFPLISTFQTCDNGYVIIIFYDGQSYLLKKETT